MHVLKMLVNHARDQMLVIHHFNLILQMKNTSIHAHHISIHQTNTKCKLRKLIALRMSKPHLIHFRHTNTRCQSRKLFIYESSTGLHIMYRLAHVYQDRMWSFQPMQINPKNYLLLCIYIWYTSTQEHQGQCNHCTNSYKLMQMTHEKLQWTNCRALSTRIIYQPKCIKNKAITLTEWWNEFWHNYETLHTCKKTPHFPFFLFLCYLQSLLWLTATVQYPPELALNLTHCYYTAKHWNASTFLKPDYHCCSNFNSTEYSGSITSGGFW